MKELSIFTDELCDFGEYENVMRYKSAISHQSDINDKSGIL